MWEYGDGKGAKAVWEYGDGKGAKASRKAAVMSMRRRCGSVTDDDSEEVSVGAGFEQESGSHWKGW